MRCLFHIGEKVHQELPETTALLSLPASEYSGVQLLFKIRNTQICNGKQKSTCVSQAGTGTETKVIIGGVN